MADSDTQAYNWARSLDVEHATTLLRGSNVIATNRRQLARLLQDRMNGNYPELSNERQPERRQTLIKTYLIDAHGTWDPEEVDGPGFVPRLTEIVDGSTLGARFSCEIHPGENPHLATICARNGDRVSAYLYVDAWDPRYWVVHTTAASQAADWIVGRLVEGSTRIDRVLIPAQLLDEISGLGSCVGLGLDFDRRVFSDEGPGDNGPDTGFLKMQLWGHQARRLLELMRHEPAFTAHTMLSRLQIRCQPDGNDQTAFSVEEIRLDGKITAGGTWFEGHANMVRTLKEAFARAVGTLESDYSIRARSTGDKVTGRALAIDTNRAIEDLEAFTRTVFSGSGPFKLWGVPRAANGLLRVRATDLGLGGRLDFEITPSFIRVYLPSTTSGSTVLRFYTNLQRHHDARVRLLNEEEKDVLES